MGDVAVDKSTYMELLKSFQCGTKVQSGHFDIFRCGLDEHLHEIANLMEKDNEFLLLVSVVNAYCHFPYNMQEMYFEATCRCINKYIYKNIYVTWGYYLFLLICLRLNRTDRCRMHVSLIFSLRLTQCNSALFFQSLLYNLILDGDYDKCLRTLASDNHRGRWDYAMQQIAFIYKDATEARKIFIL